MPKFQFEHIKISGMACAVPSEVVRVEDFAPRFGAEYCASFSKSTGIREFRRSKEHQTASDLCYAAAEELIARKNIDRSEIGALIFVAHSTDYRRPATACVLHHRLGLDMNCAAFDVGLGCSAFVYGLSVACSMMQTSDMKKAMLLVGETLTKMTNPLDKSVAMLFGDGGAAILLERTNEDVHIRGMLKTDGSGYRAIISPAGGFRNMNATREDFVWKDGNIRNLYNTIMDGEAVFTFTISDVPRTIKEFFADTGTSIGDYDCLAFHQANQFIAKQLVKKLKTTADRMPLCLDRYGNPSAPAIPMVICDRYGESGDNRSLRFLMCGFGVGLSWGVCSATICLSDIFPIIESDVVFEEGIIDSPSDMGR